MADTDQTTAIHVVLLFNEPVLAKDDPDAESEHEIVYTAHEVEKYLVNEGFRVSLLGARDPGAVLKGLQELAPDVVFNLFEGIASHYESESTVAGLLEWLGIPFTGSPSTTLSLARDKPRTKALLRGMGLPVTECLVILRVCRPARSTGRLS
ncbi:MAG: hypothetical protein EBS30_01380 [Planctomycetes bacterium]|nr:hypothetical protein [Planctomycetota bacterium]